MSLLTIKVVLKMCLFCKNKVFLKSSLRIISVWLKRGGRLNIYTTSDVGSRTLIASVSNVCLAVPNSIC